MVTQGPQSPAVPLIERPRGRECGDGRDSRRWLGNLEKNLKTLRTKTGEGARQDRKVVRQNRNKTGTIRHHPFFLTRLWTTLSGFESLPPSHNFLPCFFNDLQHRVFFTLELAGFGFLNRSSSATLGLSTTGSDGRAEEAYCVSTFALLASSSRTSRDEPAMGCRLQQCGISCHERRRVRSACLVGLAPSGPGQSAVASPATLVRRHSPTIQRLTSMH